MVPYVKVTDAVAHSADDSRAFEAWPLGPTGRGGVRPSSLQQVGAVHTGAGNVDENLAGTGEGRLEPGSHGAGCHWCEM